MKRNISSSNIIYGLSGLLGLTFIILMSLGFSSSSQKIAYVDTFRIYQEFTMTIDLDKKFKEAGEKMNERLDSLQYIIEQLKIDNGKSQMQNEKNHSVIHSAQQHYEKQLRKFEDDQEQMKHNYSVKIWNMINEYMSEFGKKEGFELIHGATGNGTLMFGAEEIDVTDEALTYINNRYAGSEK